MLLVKNVKLFTHPPSDGISSIKGFHYPPQNARPPKAVGTNELARLINRRLAITGCIAYGHSCSRANVLIDLTRLEKKRIKRSRK